MLEHENQDALALIGTFDIRLSTDTILITLDGSYLKPLYCSNFFMIKITVLALCMEFIKHRDQCQRMLKAETLLVL